MGQIIDAQQLFVIFMYHNYCNLLKCSSGTVILWGDKVTSLQVNAPPAVMSLYRWMRANRGRRGLISCRSSSSPCDLGDDLFIAHIAFDGGLTNKEDDNGNDQR